MEWTRPDVRLITPTYLLKYTHPGPARAIQRGRTHWPHQVFGYLVNQAVQNAKDWYKAVGVYSFGLYGHVSARTHVSMRCS